MKNSSKTIIKINKWILKVKENCNEKIFGSDGYGSLL